MRQDAREAWQVWTACADLSQSKQRTAIAGRDSADPVWSPDGSRIAFDGTAGDPDPTDGKVIVDVYTMDRAGGSPRKLTRSVGISGDPAYSRDGSLIAFEADQGDYPAKQGIYVMNAADGSGLRRVTKLPAGATFDGAARFSPNGRQILFTRTVDDRRSALFVVNLDGSGLHSITPSSVKPGDGTWSPDGTTIAFEADSPERIFGGAWLVEADGSGLTDLVERARPLPNEGFADPVWSPDGALILMLHGLHGDDGTFVSGGLAVIHPNGADLAFVADGRGAEHQPDWSAVGC